MLRLSKETDYGLVLLCHLAAPGGDAVRSARDVADEAGLPRPIVSKVLKGLARAGLLESRRGAGGGYGLARPAEEISVADAIEALEGPIAVTECGLPELAERCAHEPHCNVRGPVARVSAMVRDSLEGVTLADLAVAADGPTSGAPASAARATESFPIP